MPLYEYQCQDCGFRSEELQKLADPPLTVCPKCGGAFKRLISAPAFQFKGSGWYVTDYARQGGGKEGEKSGSSGAETPPTSPSSASSEGDSSKAAESTTKAPATTPSTG